MGRLLLPAARTIPCEDLPYDPLRMPTMVPRDEEKEAGSITTITSTDATGADPQRSLRFAFRPRTTGGRAFMLFVIVCVGFFRDARDIYYARDLYGDDSSSIVKKKHHALAIRGPSSDNANSNPATSSTNNTPRQQDSDSIISKKASPTSSPRTPEAPRTATPTTKAPTQRKSTPTTLPTTRKKNPTANNSTVAPANTTTTTSSMRTIIQHPSSSRRWNSMEFKDWVTKKKKKKKNFSKNWNMDTTLLMREIMSFAPKPQGVDVELYNMDAWHRLRALLGLEERINNQGGSRNITGTSSSSSKVVLCFNGGSSTAGAGNVSHLDRFDELFVAMIQATTADEPPDEKQIPRRASTTDLLVVNRGHGAKGSAHSGFLMHSFIPADTDIIIWEFAINDSAAQQVNCEDVNSAIIIWLDQVARQSSPPPLVILAYLWDRYMRPNKDGRINGIVFQCHDRIAAAYDFVVGTINLASYLNNLNWDFRITKESFAADYQHPNEMGHLLLANLLWDLAVDDGRSPITSSKGSTATSSVVESGIPSRPDTHWTWCTRDSPMNERLLLFPSEERFSFASWTSDAPRNDDLDNGGMLSAQMFSMHNATYSSKLSTKMLGTAVSNRQDRHISVVLPCCTTGKRLDFDLSTLLDTTKNASATGYGLVEYLSAINALFPEFAERTVRGHLPPVLPKNLLIEILDSKGGMLEFDFVGAGGNHNSRPELLPVVGNTTGTACWLGLGGIWLVFPKETLVARIRFCSLCSQKVSKLSLEYLSLF